MCSTCVWRLHCHKPRDIKSKILMKSHPMIPSFNGLFICSPYRLRIEIPKHWAIRLNCQNPWICHGSERASLVHSKRTGKNRIHEQNPDSHYAVDLWYSLQPAVGISTNYRRLMIAPAYSCVFDFPPRSPVNVLPSARVSKMAFSILVA